MSDRLPALCQDNWARPRRGRLSIHGRIVSEVWMSRGRLLFRVVHWYPEERS